jgi:hypothetical protein
MVLSIMVPHFASIGYRGLPPVPPTILMSDDVLEKICGKWVQISRKSKVCNEKIWSAIKDYNILKPQEDLNFWKT